MGHLSNLSERNKRDLGHKKALFLAFSRVRGKERKERETPSSPLDLPGLVGRASLEQEENFIFSMRASCGREKHGISPTFQEESYGNRSFRLEEVSTRLPRGKEFFLPGLFSILGHENGVLEELQSGAPRLGE